MLSGSHSADFDQHVGGVLVAARRLAAHDAGEQFRTGLVGDHAHGVVEGVGLAVERQQLLARLGAPHHEIALHLGGVEHVQRPAAVVGDEVGDVDQRIDGPQPDRGEALLQPGRRRAVLHAAHQPQRKAAAERGRGAEVELDRARAGAGAFHRLDRLVDELAHVGGGEVARDAVHAGAVRPVGRQLDLDHRIVEPGPFGIDLAERRVGGQFDDAFVVLGELHLHLGDQHAVALDAADFSDAERDVLAGDVGAGRHEHAHHAALGIGRAAHDLHRIALAGIDHAHPQAVGVGMLLRFDHARDGEGREQRRLVFEVFDLEPDHGELVRDRLDRRVGVEMLLEPGEGEFHGPVSRPVEPAAKTPSMKASLAAR